MGVAFSGDEHQQTYAYVSFFSCLFAALCSITQLYLIHKLKLSSGHVVLISTMTWFQLMYDVSHFFGTVYTGSEAFFCLAKCCFLFAGICSSMTSNFVAFVSFYVVTYGHIIDVQKNYLLILLFVLVPAVIDVILYSMYCSEPSQYPQDGTVGTVYMYLYFRIASIAINFIICGSTALQIYSKRYREKKLSIVEQALRLLALRIIYYPIVQAISRSASSYYEIVYGFDFDPSNTSTSQFIAQIFFAFLTPSSSYGYLVIFLLLQPKAWDCLKYMLQCQPYTPKVLATPRSRAETNISARDVSSFIVYDGAYRSTYGANTVLTEETLNSMEEEELWDVVRHSTASGVTVGKNNNDNVESGIAISPILYNNNNNNFSNNNNENDVINNNNNKDKLRSQTM